MTLHGGSYKRLFLESHLQHLIETFRPLEMDLYDIKELVGVLEPHIKRLEVNELLPPVHHEVSRFGSSANKRCQTFCYRLLRVRRTTLMTF